jgi:hypothetical protein
MRRLAGMSASLMEQRESCPLSKERKEQREGVSTLLRERREAQLTKDSQPKYR